MNKLVLKSIDLIDVDAEDNQNEHSGIFGFEPTLKEEEPLGSIFLIGETIKANENSSYIINLIASIIKKEYYSDTTLTAEKALENSLKKANESLGDLKNQGNEDLVNSLRFIVASYSNGALNISQIGEVQSLIVRDGSFTDIGEAIPSKDRTTSEIFFSNIASGEILDQDVIILSSSPLSDDKVQIISDNFDKGKSFDKIEKNIRKKFINYGEVILIIQAKNEGVDPKPAIAGHVIDQEEKPAIDTEEPTSTNSEPKDIENILAGADSIDGVDELVPTGSDPIPSSDKSVSKIKSDLLSKDIEKENTLKENPMIKSSNSQKDKTFSIKNKIWNRQSKDKVEAQATDKDSDSLNSLKSRIDNPKKFDWAKYLYILGIVIVGGVIIFLGYITYQRIFKDDVTKEEVENTEEPESVNLDDTLTEIEDALNNNDFTSARALISSVREQLSTMEGEEKDTIQEKLDEIIAKIDLVTEVVFDELTAFDEDQLPVDTSPIAIYDKKIYYATNEALMSYDIDGEEMQTAHEDFNYKGIMSIERMESGRLFMQTVQKETSVYNPANNTFKEVTLDTSTDLSTGISGTYGSNLYIPDAKFGSIVKFTYNSTGFSSGKLWSDKLPGNDLSDIAIDGSIYAIDETGQISKYHTGEEETFNNPTLIDEISGGVKMYTEEGLKNLYILDSKNERFVIIEKETNNLIAQLKSEDLLEAQDFILYQRDKHLYVITSTGIIFFDASEYEN